MNEYYLASQLPYLSFGQAPRISSFWFLEEAGKWLSRDDLSLLRQTNLEGFSAAKNDTKTLKTYKDFESGLRKEIAALRVAGKAPETGTLNRYIHGTPLEVEIKLLKARWDFIEALVPGHHCDRDFFLLYWLKLQILERLFEFDKIKGQQVFDRLCECSNQS